MPSHQAARSRASIPCSRSNSFPVGGPRGCGRSPPLQFRSMPVIRGTRVVTPSGTRAASIHIHDGRIARVADYDDVEGQVVDYDDLTILPGIVDSHVHVNEPGRTEGEGLETAPRAAAA